VEDWFLEESKDTNGGEEFVEVVVERGGAVVGQGEGRVEEVRVWWCETAVARCWCVVN
jgi:hypothetical protein